MKKFLSLVLALAMTFALVTVGASAKDFTDNSKITYKEAVDVMSGIGIISGYKDGSFGPTANLTRGAAAKIICYLNLGTKAAEALTCDAKPYKDVAVDSTFAPYIAYCKNAKLIDGYTDGTFRAGNALSGFAFAKMLLTSLGYDSAIEEFTGSNWSVKVASLGVKIGLFDGNDAFVGNKTCTRQEACLYAFNTLTATTVEYKNKGTTVIVNGATIATGASEATKVDADAASTTTYKGYKSTVADNDAYKQFCEAHFSDLKYTDVTGDDLGRPAHEWTYKTSGKTSSIGTYSDTASLVYTAAVDASDMKTNLKNYTSTNTANVVYKNTSSQAKSALTGTIATDAATIAGYTGNGKTVEIYADDNNVITRVVTLEPILAEVSDATSVAANTSHGAYTRYALTGKGTTYTRTTSSKKLFSTVVTDDDVDGIVISSGKIAKNDMVTFYAGAEKIYVQPTTKLSGILTAVTNKGKMTIGGTVYSQSAADGFVAPSVSKTSQDFYVDSMGYVVKSYTSTTANYAYVIPGTVKTVLIANTDGTYSDGYRATIAMADGTTQTVTTNESWAKAASKANGAATTTDVQGKVISYTTNSKSQYVLDKTSSGSGVTAAIAVNTYGTALTALADDTATFTAGSAVGKCGYANNNTLYVVCNYTDDDDDSTTAKVFSGVTLYTGYKNAPTYGTYTNLGVALDNDSDADSIANVVFIGSIDASATDTGKYVYVKGSYTNTSAGYVFDTVVAGADSTSTQSASNALAADTLYDAIGTKHVATATAQTIQNKGGLLYLNGNYVTGKTIADDIKVYKIDMNDDTVITGTATDLSSTFDASPDASMDSIGTRGVYVEYDGTKVATVYILFNSEDNVVAASR